MSKRGRYLGGHTVVRPGSDFFSGRNPQKKRQRITKNMKSEAVASERRRLAEGGMGVVSTPSIGDRLRDRVRLLRARARRKNIPEEEYMKQQIERLERRMRGKLYEGKCIDNEKLEIEYLHSLLGR